MALPFPLASIDGGGSYLFILSIYDALSFFHLYVQGALATAMWIALTSTLSLTMMTSMRTATMASLWRFRTVTMAYLPPMTTVRFIWDPGIASCAICLFKTFAPTVLHSRRSGISMLRIDRPPVPFHASIGWMSPIDESLFHYCHPVSYPVLLCPTSTVMMTVTMMRRQWDPGTLNHSKSGRRPTSTSCRRPTTSELPCFLPSSSSPTMMRLRRRQWDPGITAVGTPSLVALIVHYCHPVLSRPTVPNII